MADVQQLVDLRVEQRFALNVKIDMFGMPLDLIQRIREGIDFNKIRLAFGRRTEAASEIAYARDLDIEFLEFLQLWVLQSVMLLE
jgi:hypothetical protein